jgi:hypothetical protein
MEPKEFRICNLVYRIDRSQEIHLPIEIPMKVLNIGLFYSEICHADLSPHEVEKWQRVKNFDLSAIELSEEWLLKFGFKYSNLKTAKEGHYLLIDEAFLTVFDDGVHYMGRSFNHIKYVHQLQNLFFAITGKELNLK